MTIAPPGPEARIFEPCELNREARIHLEAGFPRLWLAGEVSNLARPASGHLYFTIKDSRAQVRCALFRSHLPNCVQVPDNGDQVLARGRISLYEPRGDYQLIADALMPAGAGALQQAFEALKKKLEDEGLFVAERKRALPVHPRVIAVVTSPSGAAIRDILTTLKRRWPLARVALHASPVQGQAAVPGLLRALGQVAVRGEADVVLIARGGGSIEDLWAFNDEQLARRIAEMPMPVVSGVGHETDFTIADFVADLRAATPTAAAEAVTPDGQALLRQIRSLRERAVRSFRRQLEQGWQRVDTLDRRLARQHPSRRLAERRRMLATLRARLLPPLRLQIRNSARRAASTQRRLAARHPGKRLARDRASLGALQRRLFRIVRSQQSQRRQQFAAHARALHAVSPLAVLGRGYAWVENERGEVLARRDRYEKGQPISLRFSDFIVDAEVLGTRSIAGTRTGSEE